MVKILTTWFLLVSLLPFSLARAAAVKTLADFEMYNRLHILRVQRLGEYIYLRFRDEFPDVDAKMVYEFLGQHDFSKLTDQYAIREVFKFYGVKLDTPEKRAQMQALAARLNKVDEEYALAFFRSRKLVTEDGQLLPAAQQLKRIEAMSDTVDRYRNPLSKEEFGREMYPASAMERWTPTERWIVRDLENRYFELVVGMFFAGDGEDDQGGEKLPCEVEMSPRSRRYAH